MKELIVIEGPTAVGKTEYAIRMAEEFHTEILSADSRQFYKELNIGVARPSEEELNRVKHHFIAHLSIFDYYSAAQYESDALALLDKLFQTHDYVVMAGGSGLYVNAVCNGIDVLPDPDLELRAELLQKFETEGIESLRLELKILDPDFYKIVDIANPKRLLRALEVCITTGKPYSQQRNQQTKPRPFSIRRIALNRPKEELYDRINRRVDIMLEMGLIGEVRALYSYKDLNALNTVGYKELFEHFDGKISLEQAITDIKTHSRRYAKRQLTWLRGQENLEWVEL